MQYTRRLALGAIASAVLAGCGGGGGGGDPAPSAGAGASGGATGPASGSGSTAGNPSGQPSTTFGPTLVARNASAMSAPAVARLAGGGSVVLWVEGQEIHGRRADAGGAFIGDEFVVNPGYGRALGQMAVAPTADGGFVVAWVMETELPFTQFSSVQTIQARRYDAAATLAWEARATGTFHSVSGIRIEPAGDGFLLGWIARPFLTAPDEAWLGRIAANGSQVGDQVPVAVPGGGADEAIGIAPLPNGNLVAVWRRRSLDTGVRTMFMRHFAGDLNPLAPAVALPGAMATTAFPVDAEGLPDGNVAIAWGSTGQNTRPFVSTAVFTPAGVPVSSVQSEVNELPVSDLGVVPLGAGYGVAWQVVRLGPAGNTASQFLWRLGPRGAPLAAPEGLGTRTISADGSGADFAGGADGRVVLAYHQAGTTAETWLAGR